MQTTDDLGVESAAGHQQEQAITRLSGVEPGGEAIGDQQRNAVGVGGDLKIFR